MSRVLIKYATTVPALPLEGHAEKQKNKYALFPYWERHTATNVF